MDFSHFTEQSKTAIRESYALARQLTHGSIEPQVMMVALNKADKELVVFLLSHMSVDSNAFRQSVAQSIQMIPQGASEATDFSPTLKQILAKAATISSQRGDRMVAPEHIFAAFFEIDNPVKNTMLQYGINADKLKRAIDEYTHSGSQANPGQGNRAGSSEQRLPTLKKFAQNMNKLAEEGKIEPVIGRDAEIRRVLQILTRKTKNNPLLVGAPGTGKTAIAEGLAHRIVKGDVPEEMKTLQIHALDFTALVAGAGRQGEFEARLKDVIEEAKSDPNIVLFIDEIHLLIGAGQSAGAMDAANILKPALARGEIKVVGATTIEEFRKYVESDKAFSRRFQRVTVDAPDVEAAITIMRGIKSRFEKHHRIKILDEAIVASVKLSDRYISDRFLPDKAIDLIDEAASRMRIEQTTVPVDIDELTRTIRSKEMERESLKQDEQEHDLTELDREIANLKEKERNMYAKWQNERRQFETIQQLREQKESLEQQRDDAQAAGRYTEAVGLEHQINTLDRAIEQQMANVEEDNLLMKFALDEDEICHVVTSWTGIPVESLREDESNKLLHLEEILTQSVKGQPAAVKAVCNAIRRNRLGFSDPNKPIASFLFMGTTGVGKTELAKTIAEYLFNSRNMMVRIDMSEYQQEHSVARLFGAPPGYVGYDQGGQLTEAIRRKPYSVVLLDEIEKAHKKVFETMLQVLDDGRMTDGQGNVVDFRNTIIIMTSNMGATRLADHYRNHAPNEEDEEMLKQELVGMLRQSISPEFVNRLNDIILFRPLDRQVINDITRLQLDNLVKKMQERGITIRIEEPAAAKIAEIGFDPEFGARPIKRAIEEQIVNNLTMRMLNGEVSKDRPVTISIANGEFVFRNN